MTPPSIRDLCARATPGPYFIGDDDKDPGENYHAHINSGLAVVDTGREGDWPVARFCTWPQAQLIARLSPEVVMRVVNTLNNANEALRKATHALPRPPHRERDIGTTGQIASDAVRAAMKDIAAVNALLNGQTGGKEGM